MVLLRKASSLCDWRGAYCIQMALVQREEFVSISFLYAQEEELP